MATVLSPHPMVTRRRRRPNPTADPRRRQLFWHLMHQTQVLRCTNVEGMVTNHIGVFLLVVGVVAGPTTAEGSRRQILNADEQFPTIRAWIHPSEATYVLRTAWRGLLARFREHDIAISSNQPRRHASPISSLRWCWHMILGPQFGMTTRLVKKGGSRGIGFIPRCRVCQDFNREIPWIPVCSRALRNELGTKVLVAWSHMSPIQACDECWPRSRHTGLLGPPGCETGRGWHVGPMWQWYGAESRLEGVNRQNLKFINLNTHKGWG
jgi:hypothetical protein